jgi:hypothetical protein
MAGPRQLVLIPGGDRTSLGTRREALRALEGFNTFPDGSAEGFGEAYGPGIRVSLPMVGEDDAVSQLLVSVVEEEIAWPVLQRISRGLGWAMMDPETGRTFGGSGGG